MHIMHQVPRFEKAAITVLELRSYWSDPREAQNSCAFSRPTFFLISEIALFPMSPFRT